MITSATLRSRLLTVYVQQTMKPISILTKNNYPPQVKLPRYLDKVPALKMLTSLKMKFSTTSPWSQKNAHPCPVRELPASNSSWHAFSAPKIIPATLSIFLHDYHPSQSSVSIPIQPPIEKNILYLIE